MFCYNYNVYTKKCYVASKQKRTSTIRVNLLKPNGGNNSLMID